MKTKAEALAREHPRLSACETPTERHGTRPSRSPRKELPPPALDFGLLASGTARQYIKAPSLWYFIAAAPANQHPSLIPSNSRAPGRRRAESDCCPNAWLPLATGLHCPPCSFPQPRIGQQPPNWSPRFHHAIPLPLAPSTPVTWVSLLVFSLTKHGPASEPLHWLHPGPRMLFPRNLNSPRPHFWFSLSKGFSDPHF